MAVGAASQRAARVDPPWHPERHAHSSRRVAGARVSARIPTPAVDAVVQRLLASPQRTARAATGERHVASAAAWHLRALGYRVTVAPVPRRDGGGWQITAMAAEVAS